MIVVSRDAGWLGRLERIAARGGWPFEPRSALPSGAARLSGDRSLAVLDRPLAGAAPARAVERLRALFPDAAVALSCGDVELGPEGAAAALSCGADEVVLKSWSDERLALRLAALRDRAIAQAARLSPDGRLRADRRAHRVQLLRRGRWHTVELDGVSFAVLLCLLDGVPGAVSRADLCGAIERATGRSREPGAISRRIAALRQALRGWPGRIESLRGGLYRLTS